MPDATVNIEEKLIRISNNVQESMRFAEAKNAALITFNGAALYVLVEGNSYLPPFIKEYWIFNAVVLIIGITLSIIAFLPSMGSTTKITTLDQLFDVNNEHYAKVLNALDKK